MTKIKLTKGLVSREEALKLSPLYVDFIEKHTYDNAVVNPFCWDYQNTDKSGYPACAMKKGKKLLTFMEDQYVLVTVTSVKEPGHESDGPTVRVTNGEYSWRVDGDHYGVLIK